MSKEAHLEQVFVAQQPHRLFLTKCERPLLK